MDTESWKKATVIGTLRYHLMCIASRTDPENGWISDLASHQNAVAAFAILDAAQAFGDGPDREILIPDPPDDGDS